MLPRGLAFIDDFLVASEQEELLRELASLQYRHDTFRNVQMKRSSAEFGYRYFAVGRKIEMAPKIPPFLRALIARCEPHCPMETHFNQAFVTRYPSGAGIGWHVDAQIFGECIAGVSLSSTATIEFAPVDDPDLVVAIRAAPGSLYIMSGEARWRWKHRIVPVKQERFSVTMRFVPESRHCR